MDARKLAIPVLIAGFVGGLAWFLVPTFKELGDHDSLGKVSVPGEARLDLDEGDVIVYYEERANLCSDCHLDAPSDLEVRVTRLDTGERLGLELNSHRSSYSFNALDGTSYAELHVPAAGDYGVVTRGAAARGNPGKAVTLGPRSDIGRAGLHGGLIFAGGLVLAVLLYRFGAALGGARVQPPEPLAAPAAAIPNVTAPPVAAATEPAAELERLAALRRSGELSEADYQASRAAVIERL